MASPALRPWVALDDACSLDLPGLSRRTIYRLRDRGRVLLRNHLGRAEVLVATLPEGAKEQLAQIEAARAVEFEASFTSAIQRLARYSPEQARILKVEAARRAELLDYFAQLTPKYEDGHPSDALEELLDLWVATDQAVLAIRPSWAKRPCVRTLENALRAYQHEGAAALVPGRPEVQRADDGRVCHISEELRAAILRERVVHRDSTVAQIYRHLQAQFPDDQLPSLSTVRRFIDREVPHAVQTLAKHGKKRLDAEAPPINRDYSTLDVGQVLCGDHHQFDVLVINDEDDGKLDRPWITAWLDLRSRGLQGWHLSWQPNSQTISFAFSHAVMPKAAPVFEHLCGLPEAVYQDNGKDYDAKRLTGQTKAQRRAREIDTRLADGLFPQWKIQVLHALPYNARAKAVERWFRTLCMQFSQDQPGYIGSNPSQRTRLVSEEQLQHERWLEGKARSTPFLTMAEFKRRFEAWLVEYMQRPHEGLHELDTGRRCRRRWWRRCA
jgi:hypothetical protein